MRCLGCIKNKLSREFPKKNISSECNHPALYCLRCTTHSIREKSKCPHEDCDEYIEPDGLEMQLMDAMLSHLFHDVTPSKDVAGFEHVGDDYWVRVALLDGTQIQIDCSDNTTIHALKKVVEERLNHPRSKQRLLYNGQELKTLRPGGFNTISDYNIQPYSTIHLMIVLFTIPDDLNHVIFDLCWSVPPEIRCDFLDASCLLYDEDFNFVDLIDYAKERGESGNLGSAIFHSGDTMDRIRKFGQHRIEVKLREIPDDITHLFFILSSWNSQKISTFKRPSLRLFDARNIFKQLCEKTMSDDLNSQAVIVCCVYRIGDRWTIFESGNTSFGNTDDYSPIKRVIENNVIQFCV